MRRMRFIGFIVIGSFLIIGCGNNSNTNSSCIEEGAGGGNIIVNVSCGNSQSRPLYSWEDINNDITAEQITVARASNASKPVWGIENNPPGQNGISSPWTQGDIGGNVNPIVETEKDLKTNVEYIVTVTKANQTSGFKKFTILP